MSQFEKLLADLGSAQAETDTLAKSLPAEDGKDDKKIQAAAADGGAGGDGEGGDADKDGGNADGDKDGDGKPLAKSFKVTLADGTEVDAEDGTALVKSLSERLDATEGMFAKVMGQAVDLIKSQGAIIKSQGDQIAKLAGEGRGRKTMVSITEKAPAGGEKTLAKSDGGSGSISQEEFMLKANAAFDAKRITGKDLTVIDVCLRERHAVDPALISKVLAQ